MSRQLTSTAGTPPMVGCTRERELSGTLHAFLRLTGGAEPGTPEDGQVYRYGETFCGKFGVDDKDSWGGGVWAWPRKGDDEPDCPACLDAMKGSAPQTGIGDEAVMGDPAVRAVADTMAKEVAEARDDEAAAKRLAGVLRGRGGKGGR